MLIQKVDLSDQSFANARFSAVCAVGRSVRKNLKHLFEATHARGIPTWKDVISSLTDFTDQFFPLSGASKNPDKQLALVKQMLFGLADTYPEVNQDLQHVLQLISEQIQPFRKGEIEDYLRARFEDGCALARKCIADWGDQLSQQAMRSPRDATLDFVTEGGGPTYAYCEKNATGQCGVSLVIGSANGLLKSILSLDFYFFHEYLSHVFPEWDDLAGQFSEGYLFGLGQTFFQQKCHILRDGFSLHSQIVDADIAAHRRRTGKNPHGDLEGFYAWLTGQCKPRSLEALLLELAAMRRTPDRIQEKYIGLIGFICRRQNEDLAAMLSAAATDLKSQYERISRRLDSI